MAPSPAFDLSSRDGDPKIIRLKRAMTLALQGLDQRAIGRELNVSARTVRRMLSEAKQLGLVSYSGASAEALIARYDFLADHLTERLLGRVNQLTAEGNDRNLVRLIEQIRGLERDRFAVRNLAGYFKHSSLAAPPGAQPSDDPMELLHTSLDRIALLFQGAPLPITLDADTLDAVTLDDSAPDGQS